MSRFIRIFSLVVVAIVVMNVQLQAEDTSPPLRRVVLYIPASSDAGHPQVTVAVSNLMDTATKVDLKLYDERGIQLAVTSEMIEPRGGLALAEIDLPAGSRLVAGEAIGEITGVVASTWPDGPRTQLPPLKPVTGPLRMAARAMEDVDTTALIVIDVDTMQIRESPVWQMEDPATFGWGPESRIAVLSKMPLSGGRLAYLAVDQGSLASKDPYPGSTVTTPFLCGGADTTNKSFCTVTYGPYVDGEIHPALDISKGPLGTIRDNRIMATLPGIVVA